MICSRREFLLAGAAVIAAGCAGQSIGSGNIHAWGSTGFRSGQFQKPRAVAATAAEVYVIDTTGRVQVFDHDGAHLRGWTLEKVDNGTPTNLFISANGQVLIPDTHNSRILHYTPDGTLEDSWGEYGSGTDQFIYPTDLFVDEQNRFVVSEYGMDAERVHVFDAQHQFVRAWGKHGEAPGEFSRSMAIARSLDGLVCVCDTANHRIQCFDNEGTLVRVIGKPGDAPGELKFPYDVEIAPDGSMLVCEYGNNRLSRFDAEGALIGCFGRPGRGLGEFNAPRGAAVSPNGNVFVADTNSDRIQRFPLELVS